MRSIQYSSGDRIVRRILSSFSFHFAILFTMLVMEMELIPILRMQKYGISPSSVDVFVQATHFSYIIYASPLLCAYAIKTVHVLRPITVGHNDRSPSKVSSSLWWGSCLCGGLSLFVGFFLFGLITMVLFQNQTPSEDVLLFEGIWLDIYNLGGSFFVILCQSIIAFLFGMVWSGIAVAMFCLMRNETTFELIPFVICLCMAMILPPNLQPLQMLIQTGWHSLTYHELLLYQSIVFLLAWTVYQIHARKKA